jgi:threonyl-tRNA synthetase
MTFLLPKGNILYSNLLKFIKSEYKKRGYNELQTPLIFSEKLFETSGHLGKYKENMFELKIDDCCHYCKPMNCPSHCLIFKHTSRSYKELPLRIADFGVLHRNELSGALSGMTRVFLF